MDWTHREYFRRFDLNVEQYGEILIAQLFNGTKKGDAQPCYDIETSDENMRDGLQPTTGISPIMVEKCLAGVKGGIIRIEVKSKLVRTQSGIASVIHCSDNKIHGTKKHCAATHFAVILFDRERKGVAEHAWLFSTEIARQLRREETMSRYISVASLKVASKNSMDAIVDICALVNETASKSLQTM